MIGIVPISRFLRENPTSESPATFEDFLNHLDYMVKVAGIDHVGLGLDLLEFEPAFTQTGVMSARDFPPERQNRIFKPEFWGRMDDWEGVVAQGFDSVTHIPKLPPALRDRGYDDEAVAKIMGLNFLRVFRQVWGG